MKIGQLGPNADILRYLIDNQLATRSIPVVPADYSKEQRSVRMVFATENRVLVPDYERWEMVEEILLMSGMELPANGQVPLLDCHDRSSIDRQRGSCREFVVVGPQAECRGFFDSTEDGVKAETKVAEGHVTDSSVGYTRIESTWIPAGQAAMIAGNSYSGPCRVTSKWRVREVSLTPIGADIDAKMRSDNFMAGMRQALEARGLSPNATPAEIMEFVRTLPADNGVGSIHPQPHIKGARTMADEHKPTPEELQAREAERVREIEAIAADTELASRITGGVDAMRQMAKDAINLKVPVELFRGTVYEKVTDSKPINRDLDLGEKDKNAYSFRRLLQSIVTGGKAEAGLEREASAAIAKSAGRSLEENRFFIPNSARMAVDPFGRLVGQRDLVAGTPASGGYLVGTQHMPSEFADILRSELVLPKLGVKMLTGLRQNLSIPRRTGGATFAFVAENANASESSNVFATISMSPKTGSTYVDISRQLVMQSEPSAEQLVNEDLIWTCKEGLEQAYFLGSGVSPNPTGLVNTSSVGSVSGADMDWDKLVEFETDVATAKAPGPKAFVCSAAARGLLKTKKIVENYPDFLIDRITGLANGYPVFTTEVLSAQYLIFGAFMHSLVGLWNGIEILVNPFEGAAAGTIRVHVYASMDFGFKQPTAFSVADDVS